MPAWVHRSKTLPVAAAAQVIARAFEQHRVGALAEADLAATKRVQRKLREAITDA